MITYLHHDATKPLSSTCVIAHVVNNKGGFGKGFVVPLGKEYPLVKDHYKFWAKGKTTHGFGASKPPFELGETQFVIAERNVVVANMLAQDGYKSPSNPHPLDMKALGRCLRATFRFASAYNAVVQMPMIGSQNGGGDWNEIKLMIEAIHWKDFSDLEIVVCEWA